MFLNESELKEILDSEKAPALRSEVERAHMGTIVDNQAKYVNEDVASASGDIATFTNVLVPAVRRVLPALFAKELVSIQPMSAPTGYAYAQRFYYKGNKATPLLPTAVIVTGTDLVEFEAGTTAGLVLVYKETDKDGKIVKAIAQEAKLANGDAAVIAVGAYGVLATYTTQNAFKQILRNYSGPYSTAAGETLGDAMNQVGFKIDKVTVTAKTRKLKSEYSVELVQDLMAQHGQDAEAELLNLMEYELQSDIDREILALVRANAVVMPDVALAGVAGTTEASKFQAIYTQIIRGCEEIVHDTKRGAGNIIVAGPKVIAALSLTGKLKGVAADLNNSVQVGASVAVTFVGTLDNGARVFRDCFGDSNGVLIAYKGATAADAGAYYCPYIPVMVQKATNPDTLQPIIAILTRYGLVENPLIEDAGVNPYFRTFNVTFTGTTLA